MQNLSTKRKKQVTRKIRRLHEVTDLGVCVCVCVGGGHTYKWKAGDHERKYSENSRSDFPE